MRAGRSTPRPSFASSAPLAAARGAARRGSPLAPQVQRTMGDAFGADLSGVRVHGDAESTSLNDQLGASAFTLGSNVFFRDGVPDTGTTAGAELLAHELAHTIQQAGSADSTIGRIQRRRKKPKRANRQGGGGGGARPAPIPIQAPVVTVASADSAFTRLAPLVDLAVPVIGDSGSLAATTKIPLDPAGSTFLEFDLEGELERGADGVEAAFEVAVGYGGKAELPLGLTPEIVGKLGGFVEASGRSSAEMLKLVSYGYFRQFRESNLVPKELTNYRWGQGGNTGATPGQEADQWGADLENEVFGTNDNASVGIGAFGSVGGSLEGSLGDQGLKGELSSKVSSATKYSKETLESSASSGASQLGVAAKEKGATGVSGLAGYYLGRGAEKSVGEVERKLSTELSLEAKPLSGGATFEIALQRSLEYELEVAAKGELSASERRPAQIAETIVTLMSSLRGIVGFLRSNERSISQYAAELGDTADTIAGYIASCEAKKKELIEEISGKIGGKGARSVEVSWTLEREGGVTKPPTLTLSYVSEVSAEGELGPLGAEASVERKRKLVEFKWPSL
ncbi:MAG TPA: DUF4157 domain-containing protein [Ilumatobacteraceae bacterium]|nr:DUF4157 domain-containing protein [Ilumatobacteraceae bacterium]